MAKISSMLLFRMTLALLALVLYGFFLHAWALGPVQSQVLRPDGLCATFVWPLQAYDCQEFVVESDDHFLLGVQRISKRGYPSGALKKGPVFLLHGVLVGGDVWVLNPPTEAFGFVLADEGYDVWIGNTRTTTFSYGHVLYTKKDKAYWEWSVDELAQYDLPAMLGLIKSQTNKKIHYVGYSQGTQQAFVAFSQGQLLDMVDKVVMIAPVAYVNTVTAAVAKLAGTFYIDKLYEVFHVYEFSTQLRRREVVDIICRASAQGCFKGWIALFTGNNCCVNYTRRPEIDKYETQPTATKNLAHLAQQYRQKTFAKFDYGFWGNMIRYSGPKPPPYDLSRVPTNNLFLIHGGKDALSDTMDVALLISKISGTCPVSFIEEYAHIDFILGTNAKDLVYTKVLQFLES